MASASLNTEPLLAANWEGALLSPKPYADADGNDIPRRSKIEQSPPEEYTGKGEDDALRSPRKKIHKKNGSLKANGHSTPKEKENSDLAVEDFQDKDGRHLTSLRRSDTELVSGRRAGAGWEKSK